jgi:Response regulators consisting of a CheY-like receiver domain and a winged-helix DNA-binding domain
MISETNILYIDDEPDIRLIVEMALQLREGVRVRTAGSGKEAFQILDKENWRPDLILVDVMMPEMDGPAVLARLRANTETDKVPVGFITAKARQQDIDAYLTLGAAGVITKPFDPMSLADQVLALI